MLIPQDFLVAYVRRYNVTSGELEALSAALGGKAIADIAKELNIKPNAVRKRLGEVYQKFEIEGKGPGKLVKLQQLLVAAYREKTAKKKVVLVWSGEAGRQLATGLSQSILKHPQIEVVLCRQDLAALSWRNETESLLDNVFLGLACLSNVTAAIQLNFGFLSGKIERVRLLKFSEIIPEWLANLPIIDGSEKSSWQDLLRELIGKEEANSWLDYQFSQWQNTWRRVAVLETSAIGNRNWSKVTQGVGDAIAALSHNRYIRDNRCFQQIVLHSLAEIDRQLETTRSSHLIPASLYPQYLMSLQKLSLIETKALTSIDRDEDFWQQETRREIPISTQAESVRVFVFTTPNVFERNFEILLERAERYRVRAVSYQKISQDFPEYCQNFGIIYSPSGEKLLAKYLDRQGMQYIRFSADIAEIEAHERVLNAIIDSAIEIEQPSHSLKPEEILGQMREIRDLVFERSRFAVKSVGISQYFNIENYDRCGQKRSFFESLAKQMLGVLAQNQYKRNKIPRILELGAKTGHFTEKLLELTAELWALELDWVCYKKLEDNLRKTEAEITIEHKDSCAYDPPYQFNYIFSCLSDRYIDLADKEKYLKNIKRNLERGGLLIVGDEFLPPHNYLDVYARQSAIATYHQPYLELAEQQGDRELILLERETFASAKSDRGDYKLSCEHYENLLRKIGFIFTKQQVNNTIYEQQGGVFIYKAWLEQ